MARKSNFIQIGGQPLEKAGDLNAELATYHYLPLSGVDLAQALDDLSAFPTEAVYNSGTIFLFADTTIDEFPMDQVLLLPADQIFYEASSQSDEQRWHLLKMKRAQQVDLSDGGQSLMAYVNDNTLTDPWGLTFENSRTQLSANFNGEVTCQGTSRYIFEGDYGTDYQRLILWNTHWQPAGKIILHAEIGATSGDVEYFYRVYYENEAGFQTWDFDEADLVNGYVQRDVAFLNYPLNVALFVKGSGRLVVGEIHLRNGSLAKENFLSVGGQRLVDDQHYHEELGYYFNPADLKPPLNVYFSGWRAKESYEGRWMMGSLGSPFILVFDPRIVGGAFYRGGTLEQQLVDVIQDKLDELGFTSDQLNLSGLSMGTYASLFYSTMLNPHGVVIGKPLASIGHLAIHQRLFTPYNWDLAMDTIISLTGELTEKSATAMDDDFWQRFLNTDYSKTTFIIAHMLQDTDLPFERIFNHLKEHYPTSRVLHKGLEGRHNDDTLGITSWFLKQYQNMLANDFGRNFQKDLELDEEDEVVTDQVAQKEHQNG